MKKFWTFAKEARSELSRVNWPTKQQTIKYTLVVIGLSLAISLYLGVLDYIFESVLKTYVININENTYKAQNLPKDQSTPNQPVETNATEINFGNESNEKKEPNSNVTN